MFTQIHLILHTMYVWFLSHMCSGRYNWYNTYSESSVSCDDSFQLKTDVQCNVLQKSCKLRDAYLDLPMPLHVIDSQPQIICPTTERLQIIWP